MSDKKLRELNYAAAWFSGADDPREVPRMFRDWDGEAAAQYELWLPLFSIRLRRQGRYIPDLSRYIKRFSEGF